jgi:hypothetical protein
MCPACGKIVIEIVCAQETTGAGAGFHFSGIRKQPCRLGIAQRCPTFTVLKSEDVGHEETCPTYPA